MTLTPAHIDSPSVWTDARLLYALEEVVEKELNRHLKIAKDWMPHEYVPWSDGRNFPASSRTARPGTRSSRRSPRSAASRSW